MEAGEWRFDSTSSPVPGVKNMGVDALIGGEAIQEAVTAGAAQVGLAAAAVGAARGVRGIP